MNSARALYGRLDRLQEVRILQWILTGLVLVAWGFGTVLLMGTCIKLDQVRTQMYATLSQANLVAEEQVALQLVNEGSVTIEGETYSSQRLKDIGEGLFDTDGQLMMIDQIIEIMLQPQTSGMIPEFLLEQPSTTALACGIFLLWAILVIWLRLFLQLCITLALVLLVSLPFILSGPSGVPWLIAIGGIGLLGFSFVLLTRVLLLLLGFPSQVLAVAHTVVKEAIRLKLSLFFIVMLLLILPLIPLWINPEEPLRYQIQSFISRSSGLTFIIAACMTIFLSTATVAFEIRDRQIWQLMTKPVNRISYLTGKWLGVISLNAIILLISGISIFMYIQYLRTRPASDIYDAQSVREEVLTARATAMPRYDLLSRDELVGMVETRIDEDAVLSYAIETKERSEIEVKRELALEYQKEHLQQQRRIGPGQERTYVFDNLQDARRLESPIFLNYFFHAGASDSHELLPMIFDFPENEESIAYIRQYVPSQGHVLAIPHEMVKEDGTLTIRLINAGSFEGEIYPAPYSVFFDPDALEVLYQVSTFEANFFKAMLVNWIKLGFLAMLGVACGTFLSFSVACLLCFTIFAIGSAAPFIAISLDYYSIDSSLRVDQMVVKGIATGAEWVLGSFGAIRPTQLLVEGRNITWFTIGSTIIMIGLVWSGLAMACGFLAFRRKELAIYSGQG